MWQPIVNEFIKKISRGAAFKPCLPSPMPKASRLKAANKQGHSWVLDKALLEVVKVKYCMLRKGHMSKCLLQLTMKRPSLLAANKGSQRAGAEIWLNLLKRQIIKNVQTWHLLNPFSSPGLECVLPKPPVRKVDVLRLWTSPPHCLCCFCFPVLARSFVITGAALHPPLITFIWCVWMYCSNLGSSCFLAGKSFVPLDLFHEYLAFRWNRFASYVMKSQLSISCVI